MKQLFLFLILSSLLISCDKEFKTLDVPEVDLSISKYNYKVGDTVKFALSGNADIIYFYSGEPGNDYAHATADRYEDFQPMMTFNTFARSQGNTSTTGTSMGGNCQKKQFHVYCTTELDLTTVFSLTDTITAIQNCEWEELTQYFNIRETECNGLQTSLNVGTLNITDRIDDNKPLRVAFKYVNKPYTIENGGGNIWRFENFSIKGATTAGDKVIIDQNAGNWNFIRINGDFKDSRIDALQVTMRGNSTNEVEQELWCISNPIHLTKKVNLGFDKAIPVKSLADKTPTLFSHVYDTPGTYSATFVSANSNISGRKESVKTIEITIK